MAPAEVAALLRRLRRVEGQVGGLVRMIESGRDCTDVVTQLAAASHALDRIGFLLIASGLRTCVARTEADDANPDEKSAALEKLFLALA
jgi:DNA-binding FrmR family transcriptional regulator